jgi:hypothetical protein
VIIISQELNVNIILPHAHVHTASHGVAHGLGPKQVPKLTAKRLKTDFSYALALASRGPGEDVISSRIVSERTNWNNRGRGRRIDLYLDRTIRRAKAIIEETRHRSK